ncbi:MULTISPECIES: HAAS signaling domain-containing protein [Asticcacaulis]|uniref:HAAS signaling domain-containing protein n=1 Tax=Asticcacaulis TaxID=76890 RepID=UPI001AE1109C|nr:MULTISPECIES: hypothetical protein [Asticcacaulis]MBP2158772.1 hypothetical protein [Asticcacaulis solisilvae]MDR6799818.1 hypothetical protein [Asticcacaulis sp. BE141]
MDLIEDYLRAVSRLLPAAKREDIVTELRDEILTRIEAREETLGRALTPDETEQVLRDVGHPIVVAARYRDEPQYAVGPALYPFWSYAVRLAILIQLAICVLVFAGRIIGGGDVAQAFGAAIGTGVTGIMTLIGFATVAAWLVERKTVKIDYLTNWRVRDLTFIDFTAWDWNDMSDWFKSGGYPATSPSTAYVKEAPPRDREWRLRRSAASEAIGVIVGSVFALLWWTGIIRFGFTAIDPASVPVLYFGGLADIDWVALKDMLFAPVIVYLAAAIALAGLTLAMPGAFRLHGVIAIATGVATIAIAAWIWYLSPLAPIVSISSAGEFADRVRDVIGLPIHLPAIFTFAAMINVIEGLFRILSGVTTVVTGQRHDKVQR